MRSIPFALAVCLGALSLAGCAEKLTDRTAAAVLEDWLVVRNKSGMPPLTAGVISVQIGTLRGSSDSNRCDDPSVQPHELPDLERFARAGVVHLERPESCKWEVTLSPQAERDLKYDDKLKLPTTFDNNAAAIILGRWDHFDIREVTQSGVHGSVTAISVFNFTGTMRQLARAGVWPRLDLGQDQSQPKGCVYNQAAAQIECTSTLPMVFQDGRWQLDNSSTE